MALGASCPSKITLRRFDLRRATCEPCNLSCLARAAGSTRSSPLTRRPQSCCVARLENGVPPKSRGNQRSPRNFQVQCNIPAIMQRSKLRLCRMTDARIIKKYPNRRLYDTEISRYITLEEVRQLVLQNVKFKVLDKRTREDITRQHPATGNLRAGRRGQPDLSHRVVDPHSSGFTATRCRAAWDVIWNCRCSVCGAAASLHGSAQAPAGPGAAADSDPARDADQQMPIWRLVRREFFAILSRARVFEGASDRTPVSRGSPLRAFFLGRDILIGQFHLYVQQQIFL